MTVTDIGKDSQPVGLADSDPNIVWWDGDDDPENPLNWGPWKKWSNDYIVAVTSFITPRLRLRPSHLYLACNILFAAFTVACAVSANLNMLISFRFIVGCSGSTPLTLATGTIADTIE